MFFLSVSVLWLKRMYFNSEYLNPGIDILWTIICSFMKWKNRIYVDNTNQRKYVANVEFYEIFYQNDFILILKPKYYYSYLSLFISTLLVTENNRIIEYVLLVIIQFT